MGVALRFLICLAFLILRESLQIAQKICPFREHFKLTLQQANLAYFIICHDEVCHFVTLVGLVVEAAPGLTRVLQGRAVA